MVGMDILVPLGEEDDPRVEAQQLSLPCRSLDEETFARVVVLDRGSLCVEGEAQSLSHLVTKHVFGYVRDRRGGRGRGAGAGRAGVTVQLQLGRNSLQCSGCVGRLGLDKVLGLAL